MALIFDNTNIKILACDLCERPECEDFLFREFAESGSGLFDVFERFNRRLNPTIEKVRQPFKSFREFVRRSGFLAKSMT